MSVEFDPETYQVSEDRAIEIRSDIEKLQQTGWMEECRLLTTELGQEEPLGDSQLELLSGGKARVYRGAADTTAAGLEIFSSGADLFLRWQGLSLLEVIQLPKANDFLILHLDPQVWEIFPPLREALLEDIKTAKKMKHDRQSHFRSFKK